MTLTLTTQYDVTIDLNSKFLPPKLISILFKIRDVVYVQITNISLASCLMCRSRSLTVVTSHRLAGEICRTLSSDVISYMHLNGRIITWNLRSASLNSILWIRGRP